MITCANCEASNAEIPENAEYVCESCGNLCTDCSRVIHSAPPFSKHTIRTFTQQMLFLTMKNLSLESSLNSYKMQNIALRQRQVHQEQRISALERKIYTSGFNLTEVHTINLYPKSNCILQFAYHPNVKNLLLLGEHRGHISVYDKENDKSLFSYTEKNRSIIALDWLKKPTNSKMFIAGTKTGELRLFNYGQQTPVTSYESINNLLSLSVNCEDDHFFASFGYSTFRVYEIETGKHVKDYENPSAVVCGCFSHTNPNLFATASHDKASKLYDIREKKPVRVFSTDSPNGHVSFSSNDRFLLVSGIDSDVYEYTLEGKLKQKHEFTKQNSAYNVRRSYYNHLDDFIVTGSFDNTVRITSALTGNLFRTIALTPGFDKSGINTYVQTIQPNPFESLSFAFLLSSKENEKYISELMNVEVL